MMLHTNPRIDRFLYTITEVCALTGLGRHVIDQAIYDGHLVARRISKQRVIVDADLRQWLAGLPRASGHEQVAVRSTEAEQARERA
jgi:excisionase family DNA binding protein